MKPQKLVALIFVCCSLVLVPALEARALLLCAKVDKNTQELKDGSSVKLRSQCKTKADLTPIEVAIGSTEDLANIVVGDGRRHLVYGVVNPDGTIQGSVSSGSFTVDHPSTGNYEIIWSDPTFLGSRPMIMFYGGNYLGLATPTSTGFSFQVRDSSNALTDASFHFSAQPYLNE